MNNINGDKKSKRKKGFIIALVSLFILVAIVATVYMFRYSIWDAWLRSGEVVEVNGITLRENRAADFNGVADENWWKNQKDIEKVNKAIESQISKFKKVAKKNDLKGLLKLFEESRQDFYKNILEKNKENIEILGEAFENMEMIYLSPEINSKEVTEKRIAEYLVEYEGSSFSVVFIFIDGKWLIYSL